MFPEGKKQMLVNTSNVYHMLQASKHPIKRLAPYLMEISILLTKKKEMAIGQVTKNVHYVPSS